MAFTLYDQFNGSSLSASWTGSATVSGGEVDTRTNPILSASTFTYDGSDVVVCLGAAPLYGNTDIMAIGVEHPGTGQLRAIGFSFNSVFSLKQFDSSYNNAGTITTLAAGPWIRLRFSGANTIIATSSDGVSWTDRYTDTSDMASAWSGRKFRLANDYYTQVGTAAASAAFLGINNGMIY